MNADENMKFFGEVETDSNGCTHCSNNCMIHYNYIKSFGTNAFSFSFVDFQDTEVPEITFGVKDAKNDGSNSENNIISFSYFDFLSTFRSSASPLIPYDGIGVVIRLFLFHDTLRIYVNNELSKYQNMSFHKGDLLYFLNIQQKGSCDVILPIPTSLSGKVDQAFFPNLIPRLWTCLPFLIQVRDFNVRGNTSLRSVYSETPLCMLPQYFELQYFEVMIRSIEGSSNHSNIYVGLVEQPHAASECPPGKTQMSIGFSCASRTLCISGEEFDVHTGPILSGHVVGLGVTKNNKVILTHDGLESESYKLPISPFSQYIPVVSVFGNPDEVIINLGQYPFKYHVKIPNGWNLNTSSNSNSNPYDYYLEHYEKGPPPDNHILNFFPFTSLIGSTNYIESYVYSKPLKNNDRFEVTILTKSNDEYIVLGLSSGDYVHGQIVGVDKKTIGVSSEDGMLYRESNKGKVNIFDPNEITVGKTIGLWLQNNTLYFTINKEKYTVVTDYNCSNPLPTISVHGILSFIVNYGDFPFVYTHTSGKPSKSSNDNQSTSERNNDSEQNELLESFGSCSINTVKLINNLTVTMTNNPAFLDQIGIYPGDYIEYRDLSLRCIFMGELNGRCFISVDGLLGAVPIVETDPLVIKTSIRVLNSYNHNRIYKPVITFSDCIMANLGIYDRRSLYASRYGISFMIGQTPKGGYVMRPIVDLMNNSHCFVIEKKPPNILKSVTPEIDPIFFQYNIYFLDVVEDNDQSLLLMLGTQNGQIVGWNNVSIVPLKGPPKIVFRFNGVAYTSAIHSLLLNVGSQRGGVYFPPNYHGTTGSQFIQHSTSQRSYGSKGMMPIPPAVNLLLTTLNEQFTEGTETIASVTLNRPTLDSSMIYEIDEEDEEDKFELPLITVSKSTS